MKNALKILILILSVALIIGALVMVTGAEEQNDGLVSLTMVDRKTGKDHTYADMSLDDALTHIIGIAKQFNTTDKQNTKYTDAYGVEHIVGNLNPRIKLLGNVTQTECFNHKEGVNGIGTTDATNKAQFVCALEIDLNGYDYKAGLTNAFDTQFQPVTVKFKGEGSIGLPSGNFAGLMSGAKLYVEGAGKGIRIYNTSNTIGYIAGMAGSNCTVAFKNAHIDYDIVSDAGYTIKFFNAKINSNFYFDDCYIDIDHTGAGVAGGALFEASNGTTNIRNTVIDFKSDTVINNFRLVSATAGTVNFTNTDVKVDIAANNTNVSNAFIDAKGSSKVNFTNSNIQVDIALTSTGSNSASSYYVFYLEGTARVVVDNTCVDADCSVINTSSAGQAGVPVEGVADGTYAFVAKNSKLIAVPNHPTTLASAKAHENIMATVLRHNNAVTGDIYFLDTYLANTFRGIEGFGTGTSETASAAAAMITFDNSTYEWEKTPYTKAGMGTGFVPRLFNNLSYANFINGSRLITNGVNFSNGGGGGSTDLEPSYQPGVNGTNTLDGNDGHTIDLAVGTRLSANNHAVFDLPANTKIIEDMFGDLECPYVVVADDYVSPYLAKGASAGGRPGGYYTSGNEIGGRTGVWQWMLPKAGDDSYTVHDQTVTLNDDGTVTFGNSSYFSALGGNLFFGGEYKVAVYHMDIMPASSSATSIPIKMHYTGCNADGGTAGYFYQDLILNADGTSNKGTMKLGVWNSVTVVVDLTQQATTNLWAFVNGEQVDAIKVETVGIKEMRPEMAAGTYPQGASIAVSNSTKAAFKDYGKFEAFDVNNYKDILKYENFYSEYSTNALRFGPMVGNTPYATIEEALTAAKAAGGHVGIWSDFTETEPVLTEGKVYTNGYTLTKKGDYVKNLLIKDIAESYYPEGVEFYATKDVTYTWNTINGTTSIIFQQGGTPFIDDRINTTTKGKIFFETGILYFNDLTWSHVNPADYDSFEAYSAALEGATVYEADGVPAAVEGDLNFYPVYSEADYVITSGKNIFYHDVVADFGAEITAALKNDGIGQYAKIDVILYNDVVAKTRWYGIGDNYIRTDTYFDLNGFTLSVENTATLASSASSLRFFSTVPGGTIIQISTATTENGDYQYAKNSLFETAGGGGCLYFGSPDGADCSYSDNLTVMATNMLDVWTTKPGEKIFVNGGTYVKIGTGGGGWFNLNQSSVAFVCNPKNATFVNASGVYNYGPANMMFHLNGGSKMNFTNCDIIGNDATRGSMFSANNGSTTEAYTLTDCRVAGIINISGDATDTIAVAGNTVAYNMSGVNASDENTAVAYTKGEFSAETVTYKFVRPVIKGGVADYSKYVYYTNDPDFTAEDAYKIILIPDMNTAVVAKSDVTEYTWVNLAGDAANVMNVKNGENVLDFAQFVSIENLAGATLNVAHTGEWTVEGTTVIPTTSVTVVEGFGAFYNLSLYMNFDINFYVPAEFYAGLDQATKDLLSEETVNIDGTDYYYMEAVEVDANQVFTTTTFTVTLVEGGYTKTLKYTVSVKGYLNQLLNTEALDNANYELAYVITDYLADAYAYFTVKDAADGANILASMIADKASYAPASNVTTLPAATTAMGDASGSIAIYVDLTSSPKFVITALEDGVKIAMAGAGEKTLAKDEVYEISKRVFDFDNEITVTKADGKTGTYDLVAYLNTIASDAALADLAVSFYNYVTYAEAFRPAGT